jgi:hypothetical protein
VLDDVRKDTVEYADPKLRQLASLEGQVLHRTVSVRVGLLARKA